MPVNYGVHAPEAVHSFAQLLESGPYKAERLRFEVDRDLWIPGVFVRKDGRPRHKTVLILQKYRGWNAEASALLVLERSYALLLLDVRAVNGPLERMRLL